MGLVKDRHRRRHLGGAMQVDVPGLADTDFPAHRSAREVPAPVQASVGCQMPHVEVPRDLRQVGQELDGAGRTNAVGSTQTGIACCK